MIVHSILYTTTYIITNKVYHTFLNMVYPWLYHIYIRDMA